MVLSRSYTFSTKKLFFASAYLTKARGVYSPFFSMVVVNRVSNRNSVARNCAQLFSNCAELRGVYRALNCAQVKSTYIGNPSWKRPFSHASPIRGLFLGTLLYKIILEPEKIIFYFKDFLVPKFRTFLAWNFF